MEDRRIAQRVDGDHAELGHERRLSALPVGTNTVGNPARTAARAAGRTPLTGRSRPSRPNSPRCTTPATDSADTWPSAA